MLAQGRLTKAVYVLGIASKKSCYLLLLSFTSTVESRLNPLHEMVFLSSTSKKCCSCLSNMSLLKYQTHVCLTLSLFPVCVLLSGPRLGFSLNRVISKPINLSLHLLLCPPTYTHACTCGINGSKPGQHFHE